MKKKIFALLLAILPLSGTVRAEFMLTPLTSFGGGDGWLSPTESSSTGGAGSTGALGTGSLQRGMTYYGPRDEVYVVDRNAGNFVRVLNGSTGAFVRTLTNTTSLVAGGTFASNMIAVGSDGAIYMANLAGVGNPFRVYRWADSSPGTEPTLAFSAALTGSNQTAGSRAGDSFAIFGGGSTARLAVSGSGATGVGLLDTADGGVTFTQTASVLSGAPAGSLRLGLDFIDSTTVIGKQTGAGNNFIVAPLTDPASANSFAATNISEAPLAYYGPDSLLATVDISTSNVRLYNESNATSLGTPQAVPSNLTTALVANGNGVGDLAFGVGPSGLRLYVMNTNNGIQAFNVVTAVPEPSSIALVTLGAVGVVARRRQLAARKQVS